MHNSVSNIIQPHTRHLDISAHVSQLNINKINQSFDELTPSSLHAEMFQTSFSLYSSPTFFFKKKKFLMAAFTQLQCVCPCMCTQQGAAQQLQKLIMDVSNDLCRLLFPCIFIQVRRQKTNRCETEKGKKKTTTYMSG